jgi:3-oxoacyl-[acyl-carrier-protein] synthase II
MTITQEQGRERNLRNHRKRVVVTGVGPVTPVGIGKEAYWESLVQGKSSFKRIEFPNRDMTQYRCQIGAPIDEFDLFQYVPRTKHSKYLGRTSQFAIAATWHALRDAGIELELKEGDKGQYGLKGIDSFQIGVILGVGVEAMDVMEHYHERFLTRGPRGTSPFALPNIYLRALPMRSRLPALQPPTP